MNISSLLKQIDGVLLKRKVLKQVFLLHLSLLENVEVVYSSHTEIAQLLSVGTIKYAIDVQPYVTTNTKNVKGYKVISEFSEEWKFKQGEEYTMPSNCMVASTNLNVNAELIAEAMLGFCFDNKLSADSQNDIEQYYKILLELKPESIGGKIPDESFYYKNE